MKEKINRRKFIEKSGKVAGTIAVASMIPGYVSCSTGIQTINVGLIGCRGMGFSNIKAFLSQEDVICGGLCDVDQKVLDIRSDEVAKITGSVPRKFSDFRDMLKDPDINTVIIGTPDHWHANMVAMACEAGKHVYVEKPMAHSIEECMYLEKLAEKYPDCVIQVGMWQRSSQHWNDAADYVKSGKLGQVGLVKAWIYKGYHDPIPPGKEEPVPEHVDYDMWLGPAPEKPFNTNRFHYNFRWFWDYAGGTMTDWGVHLLDFALEGMNAGFPLSISPGGGVFQHEKGAIETPDIQQALYNYPTHTMVWECGMMPGMGPYNRAHGVAFIGTNGTLVVSRGGWEVIPIVNRKTKEPYINPVPQQAPVGGLNEHVANFISCIRKGGKLNAGVALGSKVAIVSEMGNIAWRLGKTLHWNNDKNQFEEEDANKLMKVTYRSGWQLPEL